MATRSGRTGADPRRPSSCIGSRATWRVLLALSSVALVVSVTGCSAEPTPDPHVLRERATMRAYLISSLRYLEREGLHVDDVDWPRLRERSLASTAQATTLDGIVGTLILAAFTAGGTSSAYLRPDTVARIREADRAATQAPVSVAVNGPVGMVVLPTARLTDVDHRTRWAVAAADAISASASAARCGWILDLRGLAYGNAIPALAAVSPLVDRGVVVSAVDRRGGAVDVIVDGGSTVRTDQPLGTVTVPVTTRLRGHPRVAVLIGSGTREAGETVALAFRGQRGVRSFGQPTAGRTTETVTRALPDGAELVVGHALLVDRDVEPAPAGIQPQVLIPGLPDRGVAVAAATAWLLGSCPPPPRG